MRRAAFAMVVLVSGALVSGCSEVGRNEIRLRHAQQGGYHAVVLENSRVRIAVLPDLGGRLSEYTLKSTGHNELWMNPTLKPPAEVSEYYSYGGLEDHLDLAGKPQSPERPALEKYTCVDSRTPESVTLSVSRQCATWKITRSHTLYRNSTRLFTRVVVTNLDNAPMELVPRPHPVFAVGGDADNSDLILQAVDGATLVRRAGGALGTPLPRPAGAWAAALDTKKNEAVVQVFRSGVDEVALRFEKSSYTLEPRQSPRRVAPGASAEISFDMFILSGADLAKEAKSLPVAAPVAGGLASAFADAAAHAKEIAREPDDDFYLASWGLFRLTLPPCLAADAGPVSFGVRATSFSDRLSALSLGACAMRADNATVVADTDNGAIRTSASGVRRVGGREEAWVDFQWPTEKLASGLYTLRVEVGDNAALGRVSTEVRVAREMKGRLAGAKVADKDAFKGTYASARWQVEAAEGEVLKFAGNAPAAPSVRRKVDDFLAAAQGILDKKAPAPTRGSFARFYFSRIDDSVQGWLVTLPDNYAATRKWPCLVWLHGSDPSNRPFDPERRMPSVESLADRLDVIVVEPHGRGNLNWRGPAAEDVITVLDQARAAYSIDPDRIYLMGSSMGGEGAWWLGERWFGIFAGIGPIAAPSDHHIGYTPQEIDLLPPWQQWWIDSNSAVSFAENLLNTAVYIYHGERDKIVPVEHSRRMDERLVELGLYRKRYYQEDPAGTHQLPPDLPEEMLSSFLLDFPLERAPKDLSVISPYLRWGRRGWARMEAFDRSCEMGELRAKVEGQSVSLYTHNVAALTVDPPKELIDPRKAYVVTLDGESAFNVDRMDGSQSFRLEEDPRMSEKRWVRGPAPVSRPGALVKDSSVEGPMSDVFRSRFIIVPGTLGDNATTDACREEAERYSREEWRSRQHVDCLVKSDRQITPEDRRDANLILLGGPDVNRIAREFAPALPVTFDREGSAIDGRRVAGESSGLAFVYPSPANPARYVLVVSASTGGGFKGILSILRMDFDYYVFDADTGRTGKWRDAQTSPLFGFFDQKWKFDKRTQWGRMTSEPELKLK